MLTQCTVDAKVKIETVVVSFSMLKWYLRRSVDGKVYWNSEVNCNVPLFAFN